MVSWTDQESTAAALVRLVPGQRFYNGFRREPFVNKERQGWHIERQSLGFAGPIQKGLAEALEFRRSSLGFFKCLGIEHLLDEDLPLLTGRGS
jgi:hypothetical protein